MLIISPNTELMTLTLVALCGLQIPGEQVHERRLAGAIGPDNYHPGSHINANVEIRETEIIASRILERCIHELKKLRRRL
jgi:hypothetical protein